MKWKWSWLWIGLAVVAGSAAWAADATPLETLKASNAKLRRVVFDNGLVGLIKEDHSAPVVALQVWVGAGSMHEGEFLGGGLAHYLEHMIFKGTPTRQAGDISREISDVGGDINAYTTQDRTVFHVVLPAQHWTTGLVVLADAIFNPTFPDEEWQREQAVILREFAMGRDDPGRVLGQLLWGTAYRVHPYRVPVIGFEDVFKTMTRDQLVRYHQRHYSPDNMLVAVIGDIAADEAETQVRATLGSLARHTRDTTPLPTEPPQMATRTDRKEGDYEMARLQMAWHTVPLSHPDTPALDLLSVVAGSGRSSQLNRELKEKRRLVYGVDAWSYTPKDPGIFGISASYAPEKEAEVLAAIEAQITRWRQGEFDARELEKARRMVLVGELGGLQTMDGQAGSYASGEFFAGNARYAEQYLETIAQIKPADLAAVARKYLTPGNRTLVVLAPRAKPADEAVAAPSAAQLPAVTKRLLSNDVPLIVREDHRLPFVYCCAALQGGLLSETSNDVGITQLMADLLTRGTPTRKAEDIAETVESLGGSLSGFSGRNSWGLMASCLTPDTELFFELLSDCLQHPAFPPDEFRKQRELQLVGIRQKREQPMTIAQEALQAALFPGHPYQWFPNGHEATVTQLAPAALKAHHARLLSTSNLVLAVFGDITADRAQALAERWFHDLPQAPAPRLEALAPPPRLPIRMKRREPREQAILLMGFPGVRASDPRVDALNALEDSLSGLSSDLAVEVRDKRGLVYFIGASQMVGLQPGFFMLYAGAREETIPAVEEQMDEQLARLAKTGLRAEEFERARAQMIAAEERALQDNGGLAQSCALDELYGLGYQHRLTAVARLRALTPEAVRQAAEEILRPDHKAVSIVLPPEPPGGEVTHEGTR